MAITFRFNHFSFPGLFWSTIIVSLKRPWSEEITSCRNAIRLKNSTSCKVAWPLWEHTYTITTIKKLNFRYPDLKLYPMQTKSIKLGIRNDTSIKRITIHFARIRGDRATNGVKLLLEKQRRVSILTNINFILCSWPTRKSLKCNQTDRIPLSDKEKHLIQIKEESLTEEIFE